MLPFVPVITEIVSTVASLLPKIIEIVGKNFLQLAQIISGILKGLGILKPDEEATDLGDKALQAEEQGIKPENYDSYADYLKAVEEFETDPEKSATIDEGKKLEKGVEVITATLVERYGEVFKDFLLIIANHPTYFENRMPHFTELAKNSPTIFADITHYIQGSEKDTDKRHDTLQMMFDVEKKVNPDAKIDNLMKDIEKLKD